ncbi:2-succinyl-6-hydroxy-2,4-cyclohexadiene-1-carboxylate synthase [anaerobic digester metagenome]
MKRHIELTMPGGTLRGYLDLPEGSGPHPAVVAFHGFTGDCTEHKFLLARLGRHLAASGIAVLRLSFLGSGESDGEFYDTALSDQARQGERILDWARSQAAIDPDRMLLLGMSMGGCVATLVAQRRQSDLRGLILLAPAFRYAEKYRERYDESGTLWHGNLAVGRAFLDECLACDFAALLSDLKLPVRFFHGSADASVPLAVSEEFVRWPQDARLTRLPGTDHGFDTPLGITGLFAGVESAARELLNRP